MNAYEELGDNDWHDKQEAHDLVIISLLLGRDLPAAWGLPAAWERLAQATEFLKEKEKIKRAEGKAYWESPLGKARRAEALAAFERKKEAMTKRRKE